MQISCGNCGRQITADTFECPDCKTQTREVTPRIEMDPGETAFQDAGLLVTLPIDSDEAKAVQPTATVIALVILLLLAAVVLINTCH